MVTEGACLDHHSIGTADNDLLAVYDHRKCVPTLLEYKTLANDDLAYLRSQNVRNCIIRV